MATGLTQVSLKEKLDYDPNSGMFTRKSAPSRRNKTGRCVVAGCVSKSNGYVTIGINKKNYKAHRLAWLWMTGAFPAFQIDHIDGNRANNRWGNLREATNSQNQANTSALKTNRTGLKGAHIHPDGWTSRICVNGSRHFLGIFKTAEEAHAAYRSASMRFHNEFSRV